MYTIFKHELKYNIKSFLIWLICVAGMGFACILMYSSMQDQMADMAESFADMGAFSDAFGMNTLNLGTLIGYYATEIGAIHSLGGCMFAAILGTVMLSKEEDGHTGEFLYCLPVSRSKVVVVKGLAVVALIVLFNILSVAIYASGFVALGEEIPTADFLTFHGLQLLLQIEIAAICFAISSFMKKNVIGIGLGVVLLFYGFDMIARVIPDLKDIKLVSPFSYANAADIFGRNEVYTTGLVVGVIVLVVSVVLAYVVYTRRDLAV